MTYGLKTQSSRIEINTVCRRSVVQGQCLTATFVSIQSPLIFFVLYRFFIVAFVSLFLQNTVGFLGDKAIDKDTKLSGSLSAAVKTKDKGTKRQLK